MTLALLRALVVLVAMAASGCTRSADCCGPAWLLVWNDEFEGEAGSPPDASKWVHDTGDGSPNTGWGNNELQLYTASTRNVFRDGAGNLVIRAHEETDGYSSGRITTRDRFAFTFGKVEARIRLPYAQGIWPAFWMLGADFPATSWPLCGEVDIMENFGAANGDASRTHGAVHGPGYSGTGIAASHVLPGGARVSDDFHVYSIEWSRDAIDFFVDGRAYLRVSPESLPHGSEWVFNRPFVLLLNVAIGGSPAPVGYPDSSTAFPQDMLIDYVRVWQRPK